MIKNNNIFWFIIGLLVALVPSILIINTLKKDETPPFHFVPNAIANRKPVYIQVLNTEKELETAKEAHIYSPSTLSLGDGVGLGATGLGIYTKKQLNLPDMHTKYIGPQYKMRVSFNDYAYVPNTILTAESLPIQILDDESQVNSAKRMKDLTYKDYIGVGAAVACPQGVACYVLAKKGLEDRFVIKPFKYFKPTENTKAV